ncbi:hypothetical protein NC00_14170 [Xanthomonas cannabis pv. phaseoli]|uniref:Uncharacterized protein n=1 Tax=Xanthomonas cannabis pv. phaseoli TaxID=1885902 RepID=A0AB34P6R0_9XANT|nr:hypothetical protein NC00_14170 [Xanthomonas cannabis pv. phaseoli]
MLGQHLLRDAGDQAFQIGITLYLAVEQVKQQHQFPAAFDEFEQGFDIAGGGVWGVRLSHGCVTYLCVRSCGR